MNKKIVKIGFMTLLAIISGFILAFPAVVPAQHNITLQKSADPDTLNLTVGETQTVTYTITVTGIEPEEPPITVEDTNLTDPLIFGSDGSQSYTRDFSCTTPGTTTHENIASIDDFGSVTENVDINCVAPAVVEDIPVETPVTPEIPVELPRSGSESYFGIYALILASLVYLYSSKEVKRTN